MEDISIEEYTDTNLQEVKNLVVELTDTLRLLEPEISAVGKQIEDSYTRMLIDGIEHEQGKIWLAKHEGKAVGFAAVQVKKEDDEAIQHLYVSDLAVTAEQRGKGLGTKLLKRCEEYAQEMGLKYMRIGSLVANPGSSRLYKKCGFLEYLTVYQKRVG